MIDIKGKVDKEENEQLRSIPAQRLIEKLSLLKNRINGAKKRWFWELLQNASDYNKSVNVKLTVSDDRVTFAHDGAPFSLRDALNLISPDSNKQDDEVHKDNIGKFGTGLVSTHILSSTMEIEGLCVDDENESYKFFLSLNRSCFTNKQVLIEQITQAKESFKESLEKQAQKPGFNTSFSYKLGIPLPGLPFLLPTDIELDYLYDVLPYTLCFMDKVKSVIIEDDRTDAEVKCYKISRKAISRNSNITFVINADKRNKTQDFAYFSLGDVATAFSYKNDEILPYPKDLSRLFCGLPLVGTEEIGMPFLLNSFKFMPTTEREGIELEPTSNEVNRKLFESSALLYCQVLDYVANNKMKNAFHLARLCNKYNGTQISNHQFYNLYLSQYKRHLLNHNIVINEDNQFVSLSSIQLPFKESKPDTELFDNCRLLNSSCLPLEKDYQAWFDIIDFSIFRDLKYTFESLAKQIEAKENVYSFGKTSAEVVAWLYKCAKYFLDCDRFVFSKYKLLPNQSGNLCMANGQLYADVSLPKELKEIYDTLYSIGNSKIGDKLLDKKFNSLNLLNQEFTLEMLATEIDCELSSQYSKNQGNTSAISSSLNKLYNWINNSEISKEKLAAYFHWYYPKRATLIVDMLSESQREQALIIAQSGKMESLATLASSELTSDELRLIVANIKKLPAALSMLDGKVDDKGFADSNEGDLGEEIVFKDLASKYRSSKGYRVIWASKERQEPCYDFEVTKNGKTYCYCDAKTTRRGLANADSIPFFMRRSQWEFLQDLPDDIPYYIARVFVADNCQIRYIRISSQDFK